jgi:hypothetical protein
VPEPPCSTSAATSVGIPAPGVRVDLLTTVVVAFHDSSGSSTFTFTVNAPRPEATSPWSVGRPPELALSAALGGNYSREVA